MRPSPRPRTEPDGDRKQQAQDRRTQPGPAQQRADCAHRGHHGECHQLAWAETQRCRDQARRQQGHRKDHQKGRSSYPRSDPGPPPSGTDALTGRPVWGTHRPELLGWCLPGHAHPPSPRGQVTSGHAPVGAGTSGTRWPGEISCSREPTATGGRRPRPAPSAQPRVRWRTPFRGWHLCAGGYVLPTSPCGTREVSGETASARQDEVVVPPPVRGGSTTPRCTSPAGAATADAALILEQIGALLDEIDQDV